MVKESPLFLMEKKTFQNCTVQILGIIFKIFACHFGDYKTKEPICKLDGSKVFYIGIWDPSGCQNFTLKKSFFDLDPEQ